MCTLTMAETKFPGSAQHQGKNVSHIEVLARDTSPHPQSPPTDLTTAVTKEGDPTTDHAAPQSRLSRGFVHLLRKNQDYIRISMAEPRLKCLHVERLPAEWWKTGVSFLWAGTMLFCTTVMITVVHERVPEKTYNPPLPDKFFDYIPRLEWAFTVTEVIGIILTLVWTAQWLCLKHKSVYHCPSVSPSACLPACLSVSLFFCCSFCPCPVLSLSLFFLLSLNA